VIRAPHDRSLGRLSDFKSSQSNNKRSTWTFSALCFGSCGSRGCWEYTSSRYEYTEQGQKLYELTKKNKRQSDQLDI
jgi:hypothetical protein